MEPVLDGGAPASACAATITRAPEGELFARPGAVPRALREGQRVVLVEPRSVAPPLSACRPWCSRPWSGLATLPLTSSLAILRGPGLSLAGATASPSPRIAVPCAAAASLKATALAGPGRLSSPSAPSPCRTSRCLRSVRGIPRSPPPVSLLACSWLSPPRPGFRRPFAPGAPANGSQGARPLTFRSGPSAARRLLQPPQPASTPTRSSDPRLAQPERALARSARLPRFREARRPYRHARPKSRVMMTAPAPSSGGDASPAPRRPSPGCACAPA